MRNHNSATYYSLTGHAPPLDDIRLRDTQELYPAYGSTVARLKPVDDPAVPSFVSIGSIGDGSVTPGQHASFLGKSFDPFFIGQDSNSADFRLPELSLPSSLSLDRLEDRRQLQRLIDQQTDLASWSETARGIDALRQKCDDNAQLSRGQTGIRPVGRARQPTLRVWPHDLRPGMSLGAATHRGGRTFRFGLLLSDNRRQRQWRLGPTATISNSSRTGYCRSTTLLSRP